MAAIATLATTLPPRRVVKTRQYTLANGHVGHRNEYAAAPPLERGDRVQVKCRGLHLGRFIDTRIVAGKLRYGVRLTDGRALWVARDQCIYLPTPATVQRMAAKIKRSAFDPLLRRELGLPPTHEQATVFGQDSWSAVRQLDLFTADGEVFDELDAATLPLFAEAK